MRSSQLLAAALTFSSLSAAFSWSDTLADMKALQGVEGLLYKRQDNNDAASSADEPRPSATRDEESQPTESDQPQSTDDAPARSGADNSDRPSETDRPRETGRPSGSQSNAPSRTTGRPKTVTPDPRLPAGGVSMQTPNSLAAPFLYKIGEFVTFGWNFTSLSVTPSKINVEATCTQNQQLYTIAVNQSIEDTSVTWDTNAYQQTGSAPLLTEQYTLIIYDAESEVTATPRAGFLAAQKTFTFGMYTPQPYVDRSSWQCVTCTSGALSQAERQSLMVLGTVASITVLSFTWFASGFGLL